MLSRASLFRTPARTGGTAPAITLWASSTLEAVCTARIAISPWPRSVSELMRNMTASTRPHAMLHPITPMSNSRTSSRPAVAALNAPVKVSAMISPKRISETRAIGSSRRSVPAINHCTVAQDPSGS